MKLNPQRVVLWMVILFSGLTNCSEWNNGGKPLKYELPIDSVASRDKRGFDVGLILRNILLKSSSISAFKTSSPAPSTTTTTTTTTTTSTTTTPAPRYGNNRVRPLIPNGPFAFHGFPYQRPNNIDYINVNYADRAASIAKPISQKYPANIYQANRGYRYEDYSYDEDVDEQPQAPITPQPKIQNAGPKRPTSPGKVAQRQNLAYVYAQRDDTYSDIDDYNEATAPNKDDSRVQGRITTGSQQQDFNDGVNESYRPYGGKYTIPPGTTPSGYGQSAPFRFNIDDFQTSYYGF